LLMCVVRPSRSSNATVPVDSPAPATLDGVERLEQPVAAAAAMAKPSNALLHIPEKFIFLDLQRLLARPLPTACIGTRPGRPFIKTRAKSRHGSETKETRTISGTGRLFHRFRAKEMTIRLSESMSDFRIASPST
jgi:hypothetical protein